MSKRRSRPCNIATLRANGGKLWFADKDSYASHQRDPFAPHRCWRCREPMRGR